MKISVTVRPGVGKEEGETNDPLYSSEAYVWDSAVRGRGTFDFCPRHLQERAICNSAENRKERELAFSELSLSVGRAAKRDG